MKRSRIGVIYNFIVPDKVLSVMTQEKNDRKGGSTTSVIWGGRFANGPAQIMEDINASIVFDQRLYEQDIAASKAHAAMLAAQEASLGISLIITARRGRVGNLAKFFKNQ